jgi:hypothetical protein
MSAPITYIQTIAGGVGANLGVWQFGNNGFANLLSPIYTPLPGDTMLVFATGPNFSGSAENITFVGTGTKFANISNANGLFQGVNFNHSIASGISLGVPQTILIYNNILNYGYGVAVEYANVGIVTGNTVVSNTPGTAVGAITGVSVNVPTGSLLVAICFNVSQNANNDTGYITDASGGLTRSIYQYTPAYCITEYAGAGSNIQPSFTDANNGVTANYAVAQWLLNTIPTPPTRLYANGAYTANLFYEGGTQLNSTVLMKSYANGTLQVGSMDEKSSIARLYANGQLQVNSFIEV